MAAGTLVATAIARELLVYGIPVHIVPSAAEFSGFMNRPLRAVVADVEYQRSAEVLAMASYLNPKPTLVALAENPETLRQWEHTAFVVPTDSAELRGGLLHAMISHRSPD